MAARFIIDNAATGKGGALYEDFTARKLVSASDILGTERGLTTEVQVFSLTVPADGTAPSTATLVNGNLSLTIARTDAPAYSGNVECTFSGTTSAAVPMTAEAIEAAFNTIADVVGSEGGFDVLKAGANAFTIRARDNGVASASPGLTVEELDPPAAATVSTVVTGDSDTPHQWLLEIHPAPVATIGAGSWSAEADGSYNGLKGNLSLGSAALLGALRDSAPLEIAINHDGERLLRAPVEIDQSLNPGGNLAPAAAEARLIVSTSAPTVNDDGYAIGSKWINTTTETVYDLTDNTEGAASWSTAAGAGDMSATTYDPTNVAGDAFSMGNMAETAGAKVFSSSERDKLGNIEPLATADQSDAEIATAYGNQVAQVSVSEKNAGTETSVRRFSPADVKAMVAEHESLSAGLLVWTYSDAGTKADPGAGLFRANASDLLSASEIYVDDLANTGFDMGALLGMWNDGLNVLLIQQVSDPTKGLLAFPDGDAVDETGYWTLPLDIQSATTTPDTGADCYLHFIGNPTIELAASFPTASSDAGQLGQVRASGNEWAAHNGTQWIFFNGYTK